MCCRSIESGGRISYNPASFDGSYDFVSPKDAQTKLRGQRIELEEIEYHSMPTPRVEVSIVIGSGNGYYIPAQSCRTYKMSLFAVAVRKL